ncbi:LuxR C-terminal-related transcriptional regulator [Bdellovibrio bacteriovorus]|uniref:helix-turn-helix transcriptional regulator n=1 Tax=Bdellovibrio bacteriovorus TaxID=959 RepID=UPI0021CEA729|nr:LuxR C-terminal-related transcriptional regulator [Bdellovibrio bacteriovorus]UXR65039.1 LuxR C-terminal-related transcriptional regulator [Bdellovibrio bacteriovorus]
MKRQFSEFQVYFQSHFDQWGLTKTECEVGSLILSGLSLREIADLRGTSETTTRQQALSLYKKASVDGRHDLAAYFLENLLVARHERAKLCDQSGS